MNSKYCTKNSVNSLLVDAMTLTDVSSRLATLLVHFADYFLFFFVIFWHQQPRSFCYLRQINLKFIALSDLANMSSIDTHKQFIKFFPSYFFLLFISTNFRIFLKLASPCLTNALQHCRFWLGQTKSFAFHLWN